MLVYSRNISDELKHAERTQAVIITTDGAIYSSDFNHQECMIEYQRDFFAQRGIDILNTYDEEYDSELEEAISITNSLFKQNEFYGFDVYEYYKTGEVYFVAHFPQNLEGCYEIAKTYADANEMILASYLSTEFLGSFAMIVDYLSKDRNLLLNVSFVGVLDLYDYSISYVSSEFANKLSDNGVDWWHEVLNMYFCSEKDIFNLFTILSLYKNKHYNTVIIEPYRNDEEYLFTKMSQVGYNTVSVLEDNNNLVIKIRNIDIAYHMFLWWETSKSKTDTVGVLDCDTLILNSIIFFKSLPYIFDSKSKNIIFRNCNLVDCLSVNSTFSTCQNLKEVHFENCRLRGMPFLDNSCRMEIANLFWDCNSLELIDFGGLFLDEDIISRIKPTCCMATACNSLDKIVVNRDLKECEFINDNRVVFI